MGGPSPNSLGFRGLFAGFGGSIRNSRARSKQSSLHIGSRRSQPLPALDRGLAVELPEQARLAPIEALGVERIRETESLVVQMMTELVEESAQERLELDDLGPLGGAHPERYPES